MSASGHKQAALVTGSSRGIGLGAAIALARKGFNIALNTLTDGDELEAAKKTIGALGVQVVKAPFDVGDIDRHEATLDMVEQEIGELSTLVNNAGVSVLSRGDLLDATQESFDHCMRVNTKAVFFLSQAFARRLVARQRDDGRFYSLINVTSVNAGMVAVNRGEYCASKAASAMISKVFAVRLGAENIAVYDVQPGLIETDMTRGVKDDYQRQAEAGLTLIPRLGQPEEVGAVIATLATGGLPYTTGQVIRPDAGLAVPRF
jgi:3-oxoacyl-[acyl-carrier protein] reductase